MPRYDKPFTEEEIDIIYTAVEAAREQAERDNDQVNLPKLEELIEKLGFWS